MPFIPIPINKFIIDHRESAKNRKTQLALYCMNTMPVAFFDLLAALTRLIMKLFMGIGIRSMLGSPDIIEPSGNGIERDGGRGGPSRWIGAWANNVK